MTRWLLLAVALTGCTRITLRGVVRDSLTRTGIPGAQVSAGDRYTTTDPKGVYQLTVKPFRAVTLEATAPGYSTFPATVTGGTDEDQPVAYDFDLRRLP